MPAELTRRFEVSFGSLGAADLDREIKTADKSLAELERRGSSVAKALQQASTRTERAESNVVAAARKNAERRAQLLEDEEAKRTRLLELRHKRELDAARRRNEDVGTIEALHAKQRAELDEKLAAAAERQAEREARAEERARQQALQVQLADAEARARALEDANERELALLDVRHRRELEMARRKGQDLAAIEAAQARERSDAVDKLSESSSSGALEGVKEGAEEARKSFGDAFDDINKQLNETYGRFGDVIQRLGDFEDGVRLLSGFALVEVVQGSIEFIQKIYEMTDAGKEAKRQADALAGALSEVSTMARTAAGSLSLAIDPARASRLAAALTESGAAVTLYDEKLQAATKAQLELNAETAKLEKLQKAGAEGYELNVAASNVQVLTRHTAALVGEAEKARDALRAKEDAARSLRTELEQTTARQKVFVEQLGQEVVYLGRTIALQAEYRIALARARKPASDTIDLLAGFAARGIDAYDSVIKKVEEYSKAARKARADTQSLAEWLAQNIRTDGIDQATDRVSHFLGLLDRSDGLFARLDEIGGRAGPEVQLPWVDALLRLQASDLTSKLRELTEFAEGLAAAQDRDELRRAQLGDGDAELVAQLQALEQQYAAEAALAAQHGDDLQLITELYEQRRTEAVEAAARRRLAAMAAEVDASAGNVNRLAAAAQSLAKSVGASRGVLAGIERVMQLALAAKEVAAAIASAASQDYFGAVAHGAAAAAHVVAAARFSEVPGSKSGGGGSAPAPPQLSRATSTPTAGDLPRDRGSSGSGGSSTVIHIYGAQDPRGARDAIAGHYDQRGYGEVRYEEGAA